jgi:hypothetical protein
MPLPLMTKEEEELTRTIADLLGVSYEDFVRDLGERKCTHYKDKSFSEAEKRWLEARYGMPGITDEDLDRMYKRIMEF